MAELGRASDVGTGWGVSERSAIDRALALSIIQPDDIRPDLRLKRFSRTIETEIIPRLMLVHRGEGTSPAATSGRHQPDPAEAATLAGLAVAPAPDAAREHVVALLHGGRDLESVLLDVMAPTARLLGDMWREDLCTFTDVTIGLSRLQAILRWLGPAFEVTVPREGCGQILLVPAPGEQHTFGVSLLESLFQREGWIVENGSGRSRGEVVGTIRRDWYDVVGISLSCDVLLPGLRDFICSLRKASLNPAILVMLGGRFFQDHADRGAEFGADAVALDAADALRTARTGSRSFAYGLARA